MRIAVLLADGFEEVEAVTVIDFLRRAGIDVLCTGVTGRDVVGAHAIRVSTDTTVDEVSPDFDGVVIPGGMPGAEHVSADVDAMHLIREMLESGKLVGAICAAPAVVLGRHQLLRGRTFTCFPGLEKEVRDGTFTDERVVTDRNLVTSRGPGTAAEFALAIVAELAGAQTAEKIRKTTLQP